MNTLTPKLNLLTGILEKEIPITDVTSKYYQETKLPHYNQEIFEDVGKAVCIGLLDLIE
jgi:hypothetical protein